MIKSLIFFLFVYFLTFNTSCSYQCFKFEQVKKTDAYLKIHGLSSLSPCKGADKRPDSKVYLGIYLLKNDNQFIKADTDGDIRRDGDIRSLILGQTKNTDLIYIQKVTLKPEENKIIHLQNDQLYSHIYIVAGFCKRTMKICTKKIAINHNQKQSYNFRTYPIIKCLMPCQYQVYVGNGQFEDGWA
ncbi:hypothetical protein MHK_005076, partial [Candidatus Magnetomorum sp. HK-1]